MKTAMYIRVSSQSQNRALQFDALTTWASTNGVVPLWFEDEFTGSTMDRPGWNNLWASVEAGLVDTIVVWKLDRLGRTCRKLVRLLDDFCARDIRFVSLTECIDLATPGGRLMANVLASVAQFEQEVIAERQAAGIASAKAAGKKWGGRKPGTYKASVEMAFELKREGLTNTRIAKVLGVSRQTVYTYLKKVPPKRSDVKQTPAA